MTLYLSIRTRAKREACFKEYAVITYVFIRSNLKPSGVWLSTTATRRWSQTRDGDVHHVAYCTGHKQLFSHIFTCVMRTLRLLTKNRCFLPPTNEVWGKVICLQVCVCPQGECYPSMHCRWYPSMPCSRSPGGSPGPHPRGKWRGIWSRPTAKGEIEGGIWFRPTAKGEIEGDLVWGGACSRGCLVKTPPRTATDAGCTHPTGMHSFLIYMHFGWVEITLGFWIHTG